MPLSCAKAFRPTIALLYCTGNEVTAETSLEARVSIVGVDAGLVGQHVAARLDRHHDLFERGVARALADAVDGALDLPRAAANARQRIRHRQAEIVVAMDGEDRLVGVRHALADAAEQRVILVRRGVAHRVGDVDRRRAGPDRGLDAAAEEVELGARGVLRRPFDVLDVVARAGDRMRSPCRAPPLAPCCSLYFMCIGEVEMKVWMRGRTAWRNASPARSMSLARRARAPPPWRASRAGRSRRPPRSRRSEAIGKPASMMSTPIVSSRSATSQLLLQRHRRAGALLAVAQGGVEDQYAVGGSRIVGGGHVRHPEFGREFLLAPCMRASRYSRSPEGPGVRARTALRG